MQGITHEYVLMGLDLITDEEYAGSSEVAAFRSRRQTDHRKDRIETEPAEPF